MIDIFSEQCYNGTVLMVYEAAGQQRRGGLYAGLQYPEQRSMGVRRVQFLGQGGGHAAAAGRQNHTEPGRKSGEIHGIF